MQQQFTGKHITAILVGGFGVVAAVNFLMAGLAVSNFGGVVVENSYVASQKFNGWLDEAERAEALGWNARLERVDGRLSVRTEGMPDMLVLTGEARRPLGEQQHVSLSFAPDGSGQFISNEELPDGRWTIRLTAVAGGASWTTEQALP